MQYTPDDLEDFIEEETTCEITCSKCGKHEGTYGEAYYEKEEFFKKGWRATKNGNVYCPECAKKKLKTKVNSYINERINCKVGRAHR